MKKILHLYSGNLYGGVERLLVSLAKSREEDQKFKITREFGLCFKGRLSQELESVNAPIHLMGETHFRNPLSVLRTRSNLRKLLRDKSYDIVITHSCWPHAVFAPVVKKSKIVLINWVHDTLDKKEWLPQLAKLTQPNLVIANSQHSALAAKSIFPQCPIEVLYHPLTRPNQSNAAQLRSQLRTEFKVPNGVKVIFQSSRLERWKGHLVLLESLARIRERQDWVCWIAGGPQRQGEQQYFSDLKVEAMQRGLSSQVRFLGQRSDIIELMFAADIFCQPNIMPEPFGVAFIEALYAGLPVVCSNSGGAAEIITADCGRLCEPSSSKDVARNLSSLLSDDVLRSQLSVSAPRRADELCNPNRQLGKFRAILEKIHQSRS